MAHIIVGMGFGDEGKGTMTHYLSAQNNTNLVVRYNGGSQAAHNVVTEDGRHHTFAQFGSGSFVDGVSTLLSRYMLVDPIALSHETRVLSQSVNDNPLERHFIDERAVIITPFHVAANRIKEWYRNRDRHGSCGKGVGETASDMINYPDEVIRAGDLGNLSKVRNLLHKIHKRKREEIAELNFNLLDMPSFLDRELVMIAENVVIEDIMLTYQQLSKIYNIIPERVANDMIRSSNVVFEGAQGVLLDEWHGFHPYTTWSTTTQKNALDLLSECDFDGYVETIGVTRSFTTRHGAGPFPTQHKNFDALIEHDHNVANEWQGKLEAGYFDGVAFKYAVECVKQVGRLDSIAVTYMDAGAPVGTKSTQLPAISDYYHTLKSLVNLDVCTTREIAGKTLVSSLIPNFEQDINHQLALTEMLQSCFPATVNCHGVSALDYISNAAQTPVSYLSWGPTSEHKVSLRTNKV